MLKFFSTGQDFQSERKPSRFCNPRGATDKASLINQRNFVDSEKTEFKQAAKQKHEKNTYSEQFKFRNGKFDGNNKYYQSQYTSINNEHKQKEKLSAKNSRYSESMDINPRLKKQISQVDPTAERSIYLSKDSNHFHNWEIQKSRQYAFQQRKADLSASNQSAKIIGKEQYLNQRQKSDSNLKLSASASQNFAPRENFYNTTRPLLRIDNDFKDKPLIKNVQTISEDTPKWCQFTNKYYDSAVVDVTKKGRKQKLPPADLFGNSIKKHENNFMFQYHEPTQGQRGELNKMIIMDKEQMLFKKNHTIEDGRKPHINIGWKENVQKQKYEYNMPNKIFADSKQPFIKKLEEKRHGVEKPFKVNHQGDQITLREKDKLVQLKIGHGRPETINPVRYNPIDNTSRYY